MRYAKITRGGQVSVPADVRRRWNTSRVTVDDRGDALVVRPAPDDPIAALRGAWKERLPRTSDKLRRQARADEESAVARRPG